MMKKLQILSEIDQVLTGAQMRSPVRSCGAPVTIAFSANLFVFLTRAGSPWEGFRRVLVDFSRRVIREAIYQEKLHKGIQLYAKLLTNLPLQTILDPVGRPTKAMP